MGSHRFPLGGVTNFLLGENHFCTFWGEIPNHFWEILVILHFSPLIFLYFGEIIGALFFNTTLSFLQANFYVIDNG